MGRRPLRVLVADDCRDTTWSLAMLLRLWGHEPLVVHDGPSALELARAHRPDAAVLDLAMPGLDGFAVAAQLRGGPGSDGLLLVAHTGLGDEAHRRRAREVGFDHYLLKPCDPAELRRLLEGGHGRGAGRAE